MDASILRSLIGTAMLFAPVLVSMPAEAQYLECQGLSDMGEGTQFVIPASEAQAGEATRELFSDFQQNRHTAVVCLCQGRGDEVSFNIQLIDPSGSVSEGTLRVSPNSCGTVQSVGFVKAQLPQGGQTVRGVLYVSQQAP